MFTIPALAAISGQLINDVVDNIDSNQDHTLR
jgi:hypothetical protein